MTTTRQDIKELTITRIFDAPRELVWKAWTEPERMMRWWGPRGFTSPFCKIDLRVGGVYLNCMRSPEGRDYWSTGVYREIVPMERIVLTDSFADENGNIVPATHYGMSADLPLEMLVTVTFEEHEGETKLTLKHAGFPSGEDWDNAQAGWNTSLDKLAESLREAGPLRAAVSTLGVPSYSCWAFPQAFTSEAALAVDIHLGTRKGKGGA